MTRRITSLLTMLLLGAVTPPAASALQLGDPRPVPGVSGFHSFGPAVSNPEGTLLLDGRGSVALRTPRGRWLVRRAAAAVALPIEQGGFMLLSGSGTTVRSQILRADGRLEAPQDALTDARLVWEGDYETRLWQAAANGAGTIVVASRTARTTDVSGGVVAAIRDPGGTFSSQQLLSPPTPGSRDIQNTVLISPVSSAGGASVGWALEDASNPPDRGMQTPWRQATRERAGEPLTVQPGEGTGPFALPPGDGPPAVWNLDSPIPAGARSVRMYDDRGHVIEVGRDVMDICAQPFAECDHVAVVPDSRPPALTFVVNVFEFASTISTEAEMEAEAARPIEGRWVAFRRPDGTYTRPQRVTYTVDYSEALIATSGRLQLAGAVEGRLRLTPVGPKPAAAPARPIAAKEAETRGRRLTAYLSCTRRCTIRAVARYARGPSVSAFAHPAIYPRRKRRTLDPHERASVDVTLPARLRARRIVLTLTARDVVGRQRKRTFVYERGRRTGDVRAWRLRRSTADTA
ncbi:hypothetical protein LRS13_15065 [Svornostia abyssi]|uniref:Uncharacterized protein n=1 Tax=Svornostia abyssi TaxID=2898438 RepID=A0ABY5PBP4_9ACTN|nr:hypothetical protein LRS13_15065 [Parviterribacteraceae bacterium J379]